MLLKGSPTTKHHASSVYMLTLKYGCSWLVFQDKVCLLQRIFQKS
jgi:hypothetical protein